VQHGRHDGLVTEEFYRIKRLPPYVFAEVNAMKAAARARGEDIIDLGMGNPDGAPPKHVIDKLAEVAAKPTAHRYSASRGIPGLRKAQAAYYQRRFGVTLDPDKEVIVTLGSKEGLANLAQAITAPGTSCSRRTRPIRSTASASSLRAQRFARSRLPPAKNSSTG
jgi:alanine-synthesizing transaminase